MRPHGPRALLRNKENPELERIPGLGLPPPGCSPPALLPVRPARACSAAAQGGARGPEPRHLRHAPRPPRPPPSPAVPAARPSDPPPDPGARSGPSGAPRPCPAPRARPSHSLEPTLTGLRSPDAPPGFAGQGWAPDPQTRQPRLQQASPPLGGGAARPRRRGGSREVTPRSLSWGGVRSLKRCPRPSDRPRDRQTADSPSPAGVLSRVPCPGSSRPANPRTTAAALTRLSGARGSSSLLLPPAPAAAPAPPGRARAAGGRGDGRRRSGPRAGASWRRPPVAGAFRCARLGPAAPLPLRPSLPSRRRRRRAPLPPLCWLRPGGRGRGAEQGACLRGASAPPLGPPRPRPSEARPGASVCLSARLSVAVFLALAEARPPHPRRLAEAPWDGGASRGSGTALRPLAAVLGPSTLPMPGEDLGQGGLGLEWTVGT